MRCDMRLVPDVLMWNRAASCVTYVAWAGLRATQSFLDVGHDTHHSGWLPQWLAHNKSPSHLPQRQAQPLFHAHP